MPELVACPSCGCRVQVAEFHLGRRTRCLACAHVFVAEAGVAQAGLPAQAPYPLLPPEPVLTPPGPPPVEQKGMPRHRQPLCPSCHRPVAWEALACPYCGHLFDPLDAEQAADWPRRRDGENHRGGLIDTLGTVSLIFGVLSLCLGGLGVLAALATGLPAWGMARHDLEQMRTGLVDPEGRATTEFGRNKALVGIVLGVLFGLVWLFFILEMRRW